MPCKAFINVIFSGDASMKRFITSVLALIVVSASTVFAQTSTTSLRGVVRVNNGIYSGQYIRLPYAGEAGTRNNFRGDGYFDIDSSLTKTWGLWRNVKLKFAAEVYNITNTDRFDVSLNGLNARAASTNMGIYSSNLSTYRRMQFGLRLEF
jgi:hypothetical protein